MPVEISNPGTTDVDARIVAWISQLRGGTVVAWRRQPRWRPMWFVDVERDGTVEHVVVRGERVDCPMVFPLDHEMRFQSVLAEHGVAVPEVFGWHDDPRAYAMAAVPGRPDFAGVESVDRDSIVDEYLQALAAMHAVPLEAFAGAAVLRAPTAADAPLVALRRFEQIYRSTKVRPDPLVEFGLGWLRRHPPPTPARETAVVWDSGQFHHDGSRFIAMVDLELGHIGDPMLDLAGWRLRDAIIPYGEFPRLYERYAELTGREVDLAAVQFHTLAFTLTNQLTVHGQLAAPRPDTDYMTYAQWVSETNLQAIEALAELTGVPLDPVDVPAPVAGPATAAHAHLSRSLGSIRVDDPLAAYEVRKAFRLARHLERSAAIGAEIAAQDAADVAALTGRVAADWLDGERILEEYVLADGGRHDDGLIVLFHRRWQRFKALMGPPGSAMAAHHRLQPLGPSLLG